MRTADLVKERGVDFALTDPLEKEIRAAGGDDTLLLAITRAKAPPAPSPPPAVPPAINLTEPVGAEGGKVVEAAGPSLRVRGTASHPSGIASVFVNGQRAPIRSLSDQSIEFDLGDLPVSYGSTAFVVRAAAVDHSELLLTFKVNRPQPLAPKPQPTSGPQPLTLQEVEEALQNGISKAKVTALVNQFGVNFEVTDEVEQRLRRAGADSNLLLAIVKAKK